MATQLSQLIAKYEKAETEARAENLKRYEQLMGIASQMESLYGEEFRESYMGQLERQREKDVAAGMSGLVSAGLGKTTRVAGLSKAWTEQVGEPARLKLEDVLRERKAQALQFKAGIIERREDVYPDYGALMAAAQAAAAVPTAAYGGGTHQTFEEQFGGGSLFGRPASTQLPSIPSTFGIAGLRASIPTTTAPAAAKTAAPSSAAYAPARVPGAMPLPDYMGYVSNVQKTLGAGVAVATPSEYKIIQERLKKMYPQYR